MSRKLRVFVSSTMKDMANERQAVCRRLESFNFEPVNAEQWLPTGTGIWPRIQQEIESSDVFVLLLGESYGWTPTQGAQSELGLSVTHLEFRAARELRLPILPFLKRLAYTARRRSRDVKKRDEFRAEVGEWVQGRYVTDYDLASDLADKVGHALVAMLTDDFLADRIRERAAQAEQTTRLLGAHPEDQAAARQVEIPARLAALVAKRKPVLFAGAGISLPAGLPSAAVFAQTLAQALVRNEPDYAVSPVGSAFAAIASDLEAFTSRATLVQEVQRVLDPPQGLQPTVAHAKAVELFDVILTTNWDLLFEQAAAAGGRDLPVIAGEIDGGGLPDRALIKLHGTRSDPPTLLLTESDVLTMDRSRPRLWQAVRDLLRTRPLVVLGTSLRDPSIVRLFLEARPEGPGYFVVPKVFAGTAARLREWHLECLQADADSFLSSLAAAVEG